MKRFHVHVAVNDLTKNIQFYSAMFGVQPSVVKLDYAKWMLDDPRINFAISERAGITGVNHLGFQADSDDELEEIHMRLRSADTVITAEKGATCCYAKSDKYWVNDPTGIAWESFRSLDTIPFYGEQSHQGTSGAENVKQGTGCSTSCCPAPSPVIAEKATAKACCNG